MATTFRCSIVTPAEALFDGEVTYASVPAWDGQVGIMVSQSPILTELGAGGLRLESPDQGSQWFFLDGGFAQVHDDVLTLHTDYALPAESLSLEEAQAELAEANARITEDRAQLAAVCADQRRALAKISLIRTRRG